eukprot:779826_1
MDITMERERLKLNSNESLPKQNAPASAVAAVPPNHNALPPIPVPKPIISNTSNTKDSEELFSKLNEFMMQKKDVEQNTNRNQSSFDQSPLDPVVIDTQIGRIVQSDLEEFKDFLDDIEDDKLIQNEEELLDLKRLVFGGSEDDKSKKHLVRIVTEYQRYSLKYYGQQQTIADKVMKLFRLI